MLCCVRVCCNVREDAAPKQTTFIRLLLIPFVWLLCTHAPSEPTRARARRVAWEREAASAAATEGGKGSVPSPPSPPLLPRLVVVFVSLLLLLLGGRLPVSRMNTSS